jgi:calcium-dependent protein kinase
MEVPDVPHLFANLDANGDGKIDYNEFIAAAVEKTVLVSNANLRAVFNTIDKDGNGEISKEELKEVFGGGAVSSQGEEVWD